MDEISYHDLVKFPSQTIVYGFTYNLSNYLNQIKLGPIRKFIIIENPGTGNKTLFRLNSGDLLGSSAVNYFNINFYKSFDEAKDNREICRNLILDRFDKLEKDLLEIRKKFG